MKYILLKNEIYKYFVVDPESDLDEIYTLLDNYFKQNEWILQGTYEEISQQLNQILKKYQQDHIIERFNNSDLSVIYK